MKKVFVFLSALLATFVFMQVAFADVAFPTQTTVTFEKDGEVYPYDTEYEMNCYGTTYSIDELIDPPVEEEVEEETEPEMVFSYSASCTAGEDCIVYEDYYLNYRSIEYCEVVGSSEVEDFVIEGLTSPVPEDCEDIHQWEKISGGVYYVSTEEYETCEADPEKEYGECDEYLEEVAKEDLLLNADGNVLDRLCSVTFEIPGEGGAVIDDMFPDVSEAHSNYDAIEYVKDEGIVGGYPDGTYQPENNINRAEFTKIIIESVYTDEEINSCEMQKEFPDVPADEWFTKYVCVAANNGIVEGYPSGYFVPTGSINFVEAAKIIVIGFEYEIVEWVGAEWYEPFVRTLQELNAIPTTISILSEPLTRGEMAEIIYRVKAGVTDKDSADLIDWPEFPTE